MFSTRLHKHRDIILTLAALEHVCEGWKRHQISRDGYIFSFYYSAGDVNRIKERIKMKYIILYIFFQNFLNFIHIWKVKFNICSCLAFQIESEDSLNIIPILLSHTAADCQSALNCTYHWIVSRLHLN